MILFGQPLFIWFGAAALAMFSLTAVLGITRKFRYHRIAAAIAIGLVSAHVLGALGVY